MTSKTKGAQFGAKRVLKAVAWSPLHGGKRKPKKLPTGYDEDEENDTRATKR
ncbi:hypothetical protein 13VV501A_gene0050 [Vibrio phage 13VV501A]|nr:hypothetical protein 13VV501A_gene0050 [Vibrio phage 13VV501A]